MTSVKLKFRASSRPNKEGTLYFQIIHERVAKQIKTSYHILESEWDKERNEIIYTSQVPGSRQKTLTSIRNKIRWENNRISNTIIKMENSGLQFTTEDIVRNYCNSTSNRISVFEYINKQINRLYASGKERTSEIYRQVLHSFMKFRKNDDLDFGMIDDNLIEQYEVFMRMSNLCRNTTSFYMRTLRSFYNRAVEDGLTEQVEPFRRVYTGVDKTAKRALSVEEIRRIKELNLNGLPTLDFARKHSDNTDVIKNSTYDSLNVIVQIISKYKQARRISRSTNFTGISNAQSVISRARQFANDKYLSNCTDLKNALNSVRNEIAQSHYRYISAQVEKLSQYRYYSQSYYDNTLVPQVDAAVTEYDNKAAALYGKKQSVEPLWVHARGFYNQASSYYNGFN